MKTIQIVLIAGAALCAQNFPNGPSKDPSFFPIAVWLQGTDNIAHYKNIGITMYVGLWEGPTQAQLADLKAADMPVICDQNSYSLSNLATYGSVIKAWMHGDEPDNAQWNEAMQTYDPCIDTSIIQARYADWRSHDSTRPIYLNLGQGVSYISWVGRGACSGNTKMYPGYIRGCDIASFDIYPVNSEYPVVRNNLWYVPKGVDSLRCWSNDKKPVWCWIECTAISADQKPAPAQVKSEVWMALIHGAHGIGYFCHSWYPSFVEAALLADTEMKNAVAAINAQISALAPALNSLTLNGAVSSASSNTAVPVDVLAKSSGDSVYVFAAAMRDGATNATFAFHGITASGAVTVIGENRTLSLSGSQFTDTFSGYAVHLYRVRGIRPSVRFTAPELRHSMLPRSYAVYDVRGRVLCRFQDITVGTGSWNRELFSRMNFSNGVFICRTLQQRSESISRRLVFR